jgi:Domain of unknown function DUF1828
MTSTVLEKQFQQVVGEKVKLFQVSDEKYRIFTPFTLNDGDHLAITLKKEHGKWMLSDGGSTFMHLSFGIDEKELLEGNRWSIISRTLLSTNVHDRDGELIAEVDGEDYGAALYNFAQALIKISDVSYLSREIVRSTFIDDFKGILEKIAPRERLEFDWADFSRDPKKLYQVDCRVDVTPQPIFVYALASDTKVSAATIAIHQFREWKVPFLPVALFEDQAEITSKVLSRFNEVCDKRYDIGCKNNFSRDLQNILQAA